MNKFNTLHKTSVNRQLLSKESADTCEHIRHIAITNDSRDNIHYIICENLLFRQHLIVMGSKINCEDIFHHVDTHVA